MITGPVRVRFAPSPTGYLHVGGARTALFNWLIAKKYGGQFLLRIEDTDKARSTEESTQAIFEGLNWLGLQWDEEVVYQGQRAEMHHRAARALMASNHAYPCFCSAETLNAQRDAAAARKESWVYPGTCWGLSRAISAERMRAGDPYVIRFHVPEDGETGWDDLIHGPIKFPNRDLGGDFIVLRSDGTPIYNLSVVCDDIDMGITHVLRGDDHISNTPKQILLYQAFNKTVPAFGHMPMIFGNDGKKLSKRHGATAVGDYQNLGILADAMVNFLALLGWSPGDNREILSEEEIIDAFSVEHMSAKAAVFDMKKLEWMNGQYMQRLPWESVGGRLLHLMTHRGEADLPAPYWLALAVPILVPRARTMVQLAELVRPYIIDGVQYDEKAVAKQWMNTEIASRHLIFWELLFERTTDWSQPGLVEKLVMTQDIAKAHPGRWEPSFQDAAQTLRLALTGSLASPPLPDVLVLLGQDKTLDRIGKAIEFLNAKLLGTVV